MNSKLATNQTGIASIVKSTPLALLKCDSTKWRLSYPIEDCHADAMQIVCSAWRFHCCAISFEIAIIPKLQEFRPDLIVISAGFDAHRLDPLANLNLSEADFGWAILKIMETADLTSAGKVISVLEGGYALKSLARSVAAHITALMQS
jgi:hypothetical protein